MEFALHLSSSGSLLPPDTSWGFIKMQLWRSWCCASGMLRATTERTAVKEIIACLLCCKLPLLFFKMLFLLLRATSLQAKAEACCQVMQHSRCVMCSPSLTSRRCTKLYIPFLLWYGQGFMCEKRYCSPLGFFPFLQIESSCGLHSKPVHSYSLHLRP